MALVYIFLLFASISPSVLAQPPTSLPRFTVEPSDTTVQIGRTARLECEVSSLVDTQAVAWMKEATFQTSGRSVLSSDPDKISRITVKSDGEESPNSNRRYNLFIHNVRAEDAGVYVCYVVEFRELHRRRWTQSRPARLTVVDLLTPSVRCIRPTEEQLSAAGLSAGRRPSTVGCTVHSNRPGTTVTLQHPNGTVLAEGVGDNAETYSLKYSMKPAELQTGKFTCVIGFRFAEAEPRESRSCSMGPFKLVDRQTSHVNVVSGTDARLTCPPALEADFTAQPTWLFEPEIVPSRYSISSDGITVNITHLASQDNGLVASCTIQNHVGTWKHDMLIQVKSSSNIAAVHETDRRNNDLLEHTAHQAGGSRDRAAPKPVIDQAVWRILRGRVNSGRLNPSSSRPGKITDTVHHRIAGKLSEATVAPTAPTASLVSGGGKGKTDNATAPIGRGGDGAASSDLPPVTQKPSNSISPLIIVALCEAGMSLIILVIAFAVLCQCCCGDQTVEKIQGDKDLNLATASFGKQSTTPTLLTYKSTAPGIDSQGKNPARKPLPNVPPPAADDEPIYVKPDTLFEGKTVLGTGDLPPTGSWVFSTVNSENGEAEPKPTDTVHEVYVTMV